MQKILAILFCLALPCLTLGADNAAPKVRGNYLRTEIRGTEKTESFKGSLANPDGKGLGLVFRRWNILTHTEVKIYEAKMRVARGDTFDFITIPNETVEGEPALRQEEVDGGPLANEKLSINGKNYTTDAEGFIPEDQLQILRHFDDLNQRELKFIFSHPLLGLQNFTIFRTMPFRPINDEKRLEEPIENDLLMTMGKDFFQRPVESERDGLSLTLVNLPETVRPGQRLTVSVLLTNNGKRETCCLLGRIFSREDWLNGLLFYFGAIKPEQTVTISREIIVPADIKANLCFAALVFQDSWGPVTKRGLPLKLSVTR